MHAEVQLIINYFKQNSSLSVNMGQRVGFSVHDIEKLNIMYNCYAPSSKYLTAQVGY